MKILTNVRQVPLAGIANSLASFTKFVSNSKQKRTKIIGVDITNGDAKETKKVEGSFSLICTQTHIPSIKDVIQSSSSLEEIKKAYEPLTNKYLEKIKSEKPDLVLINGTYFMPWSLLLASSEANVPSVVHYHGVLTKEVAHWDEKARGLFGQMEKNFYNDKNYYIFPSQLTRDVVESEVFGKPVKQFSILPNAIPDYFFKKKKRKNSTRVGLITRWTYVKNPEFSVKFSKYIDRKGAPFSLNVITDLPKERKSVLEGEVKFYKPMDNEKLAQFYRTLGVMLSPSHFETYGNVAQEALASGTPALVNQNMGVAELYTKLGLNDWVISFDSIPDVFRKVKDVIGSEVSEEVRDKMKQTLSSESVHSRMLEILYSC